MATESGERKGVWPQAISFSVVAAFLAAGATFTFEHQRYGQLEKDKTDAESKLAASDAKVIEMEKRIDSDRTTLDRCYEEKQKGLAVISGQSDSAASLATCQNSYAVLQRRDLLGQQIKGLRDDARQLDSQMEPSSLGGIITPEGQPTGPEALKLQMLGARRQATHELLKAAFEHCPN